MLRLILSLGVGASIGACIIYFVRKYQYRVAYAKLIELADCPFTFRLSDGNGDGYIIFKFEEGIELYCQYGFGIRCDGLYGVDELEVKGINAAYARNLELKLGQSIFPIIDNMEKFDKWANSHAFEYKWCKDFTEEWDHMKKKLNNLRVLETKSKEKEKKQK